MSTPISDKIYTGIGSRRTPPSVLQDMQTVARCLAIRGWILRSGGADGADTAFEKGCDQGNGRKEIYLPWFNFNGNHSRLHHIPDVAYDIAATMHPTWTALSPAVRKLHARNVLQVLGQSVDTPSKFVICWTQGGAMVGGTATALALATEIEVPILNMALDLSMLGLRTVFDRLEQLGVSC